jgi:hypothetical protein
MNDSSYLGGYMFAVSMNIQASTSQRCTRALLQKRRLGCPGLYYPPAPQSFFERQMCIACHSHNRYIVVYDTI